MSRIPLLSDDELAEIGAKHGFADPGSLMGFVPNSIRIMARRPEVVKAFFPLVGVITRTGSLPAELRTMVAQVASKGGGCLYCQAHCAHVATAAGPSEKEKEIWDYERSPLFSEAERAALHVAQLAAAVPNEVTDADFAELRKHYTDDEIVEIVCVIALFGFLNRFNDTMATPLCSRAAVGTAPLRTGCARRRRQCGTVAGGRLCSRHGRRECLQQSSVFEMDYRNAAQPRAIQSESPLLRRRRCLEWRYHQPSKVR